MTGHEEATASSAARGHIEWWRSSLLRSLVSWPPLLLIALLIAASSLAGRWQASGRVSGRDFLHYWAVPHVMSLQRLDNIYSVTGREEIDRVLMREAALPDISERQKVATAMSLRIDEGVIDTIATPFLFSVFGLFSSGDYERDYRIYAFVCLICYTLAIITLCRLFRYSTASTVLLLALLTAWFVPLDSDIRVANVNQLQLFLLTLFLWLQRPKTNLRRNLLSGVVLGLAIMFKPNVLIVPPFIIMAWLVDRYAVRALIVAGGMGIGMGLAFAASSLYFGGVAVWRDWFDILPSVLASTRVLEEGNYGLGPLISSMSGWDASAGILLLSVAAFLFVVWRGRRRSSGASGSGGSGSQARDDLMFWSAVSGLSIGCAAMLLSAPLVWYHYYVLVIPLALYAFRPNNNSDKTDAEGSLVRVLALLAIVIFTPIPTALLLPSHTVTSVLLNLAVIGLGALGLYDLWRRKATEREAFG